MLSTALASLYCLLSLSYPYFVMIRSPVVSAEATWLQMQHDNLLWLGGDIYNNAELGASRLEFQSLHGRHAAAVGGRSRCRRGRPGKSVWSGAKTCCCGSAIPTHFVSSSARVGTWLSSARFFLLLTSLQRAGEFEFCRAGFALGLFTVASFSAAVVGWSYAFSSQSADSQGKSTFQRRPVRSVIVQN